VIQYSFNTWYQVNDGLTFYFNQSSPIVSHLIARRERKRVYMDDDRWRALRIKKTNSRRKRYYAFIRKIPIFLSFTAFIFWLELRTVDRSLPSERVNPDSDHAAEYNFSGIKARPFDPWLKTTPLPCYPPDIPNLKQIAPGATSQPTRVGFLFLKPLKTGSTTMSGVNLRLARNIAKRQKKDFGYCKARFAHGGPGLHPAAKMFGDRLKEKSFLWTIIREPTQRIISHFFHLYVSREKVEPNDANFQRYVQQPFDSQDYYIRSLSIERYNRTKDNPIDFGNQIIQEYDFIGITERMDESVVVLMMLLHLKMADVLYLSAKTHGGYDGGGANGYNCVYIWPSFVTSSMQEFFESNAWQDLIKNDLALYQAANRSLDMTIDKLGRAKFEKHLTLFRIAKSEITKRCLPTAKFPCMGSGKFVPPQQTDCLWGDAGCETSCIDKVAEDMQLW